MLLHLSRPRVATDDEEQAAWMTLSGYGAAEIEPGQAEHSPWLDFFPKLRAPPDTASSSSPLAWGLDPGVEPNQVNYPAGSNSGQKSKFLRMSYMCRL